jgi:hypothetical protein
MTPESKGFLSARPGTTRLRECEILAGGLTPAQDQD